MYSWCTESFLSAGVTNGGIFALEQGDGSLFYALFYNTGVLSNLNKIVAKNVVSAALLKKIV